MIRVSGETRKELIKLKLGLGGSYNSVIKKLIDDSKLTVIGNTMVEVIVSGDLDKRGECYTGKSY